MKQQRQLRRREADETAELPADLPPLLRRLYASRGVRSARELERSVKGMLPWQQLSGIDNAVEILYNAFREGTRIIVVGDFDADGATSTALSVLGMRALGCDNISYLVPNRFEDGYGLSPEVVDQAKARGAQLIVTVDNGISSHAGVAHAKTLGIPVIVTDHHLPGDTLPDAEAIINPNLRDCEFPSKSLAGVGVAFYLMLALRTFLRDKGWFDERNIAPPNLAELLDLVALGTVADVVPLDANNRILTWQGLSRIRAGKCRPGIKALLEISNRDPQQLAASDLGFALGPRLNAAGRLDDMSVGVALLLCDNLGEARVLASELDALNQTRKEIEQGMQAEALILCEKLERSSETLPGGLAMYHPEWHQGVVGILASRIKERFHRPVIAFAPAGDGTLKGSGRSIQGLHMRDALERLDTLYPDLMIKFGGHAMAAGLSLEEHKFEQFQQRFGELVTEWLDPALLQGEVISDGSLSAAEMSMEVAQLLRDAGPWGQMFPEPLFDGRFRLLQQRLVGERHLKVMVEPVGGGPLLDGIAFNIDTTCWPDNGVREVELAYKLDINEFRGNRSLQIIIDDIWPL
ncbi:single-stranded-DNA-specific exonuclease RecJ [Salmonella enterica subsp. enterica serovar Sandiego]|uniref:Single-stranded-DNA-specific exonuclease RecJ n=1 Tax=Salmonella enterica subsp. enterica serovar Paratyphi C TaxID=57046 RepID=A0A753FQJ6_SALET|nr:single-stranded-DNA-specific exonuclease RecJ [Salmonella enterica]EBY4717258.1 single-stranded-DNA-specific exonuclease RecJ [Salmonella enterica subsp. enterica serovar Oranienburg]ECH9102789.1 single-stranded-DNA-specific exonuclease RecJ [Salmonella enterica subsp. enterica]ECK9429962.1 single-stranded-DNA-specific exonuclease RecJ [Salmonella enterica subsp. enterica serovar Paratyphi C str. CFSAN000605]EEJ5160119.1 single-stranded-DNA-specific exonuclease RecJ [Salmonella enterica subs